MFQFIGVEPQGLARSAQIQFHSICYQCER
jgi:hypothetical protein